jgi:hypothetical protein
MCQRETALVLTLKNTLPAVSPEKAEKPEKKDRQQTFIQLYF